MNKNLIADRIKRLGGRRRAKKAAQLFLEAERLQEKAAKYARQGHWGRQITTAQAARDMYNAALRYEGRGAQPLSISEAKTIIAAIDGGDRDILALPE